MQAISDLLRRTRLEQGIELSAVAAQTKIDAKYLRAIEADDVRTLPGSFFYKSFVHQYAAYLGLDTKNIDAQLDSSLNMKDPLPLPAARVSNEETTSFLSSPALKYWAYASLALVLVGGLGLDAWLNRSRTYEAVPPSSTPMVAEAPAAVGSPAASTASETVPPVAVAAKVPAVAQSPGKVELALTATEPTWLSVSSDGTPIFSGILEPNQTKTIEGRNTANLRVGNAAGLEVRLNGTPIGSLGAHGQVRDVAFTPDKFRFVYQPSQSD